MIYFLQLQIRIRHCAFAGARDVGGVFRRGTAGVAGFWLFPRGFERPPFGGGAIHEANKLAPDSLPLCPLVFLRSNVCLPPFRTGSLRRGPGSSATVGITSPRREPFIPQVQTPAGLTGAGLQPAVGVICPLGYARTQADWQSTLRPVFSNDKLSLCASVPPWLGFRS